ncbi:tetratricopeptide repeat protein [Dactylosporangium sucinum]|uniref:tetratricopeptide repeat protein n=1 Tax=Dactylosporangium sucinum TaxID=1424081 RepID=UPI0035711D16
MRGARGSAPRASRRASGRREATRRAPAPDGTAAHPLRNSPQKYVTVNYFCHRTNCRGRYSGLRRACASSGSTVDLQRVTARGGRPDGTGGKGNEQGECWRNPVHRDAAERALTLYRQIGDTIGEARVLTSLGTVEEGRGRYQASADHHEQELALCRRLGWPRGEAWPLDGLGNVHTRLGLPDRAAGLHRQALALFQESSERDGEARARNGLGEAAIAAGRPTDALPHLTTVLSTAPRRPAGTGPREPRPRSPSPRPLCPRPAPLRTRPDPLHRPRIPARRRRARQPHRPRHATRRRSSPRRSVTQAGGRRRGGAAPDAWRRHAEVLLTGVGFAQPTLRAPRLCSTSSVAGPGRRTFDPPCASGSYGTRVCRSGR